LTARRGLSGGHFSLDMESANNNSPIPVDVVVIGGGPGGYVAAIRAAQLGLSTVCVEMDKTLGGTCVNVGCIPSKALLTSSEHYEFANHAASTHGIGIGTLTLDLATMLQRKDEVVAQNTRGIEFLFRKNKITWSKGRGTLRPGNIVEVEAAGGGRRGRGDGRDHGRLLTVPPVRLQLSCAGDRLEFSSRCRETGRRGGTIRREDSA